MNTTEALDQIRQRMTNRDTPEVELACENPDCLDGWTYDDNTAKRCPNCAARARAHAQRTALETSGIGARYYDLTWNDLEPVEPFPQLKAAANRITSIIQTGDHLLMTGPPGTGKTQAAVLLLKATIEAGQSARLLNLGDTAMRIRAAYNATTGPTEAETVDTATRTNLLVIDDLGAGESGNATIERRLLYLILEARQNNRRPTILTTNLTPKEAAEKLGQRLIGRLMPLAIITFNHGRNFRKPTMPTSWEQP